MSEIVLSNTANSNHYDYLNTNAESITMNINNEYSKSSHSNPSYDNSHHQYTNSAQTNAATYPVYAFQPIPMGFAPVTNYSHPPSATMSRLGYFNDPVTTTRQPNSPESVSSSSSSPPTPSPPPTNSNNQSFITNQVVSSSNAQLVDTAELITPLVKKNGSRSKFNNPTSARVKEMIHRATSVPMEFYHTEFLEYSKESYEKKMESKRNKRKRTGDTPSVQKKQKVQEEKQDSDDDSDDEEESSADQLPVSNAEMRRQIHIQSEQKRRAQIKDGFDELRKHLPGCNNKKMSKAALLTRTVHQLQHLKNMQHELLSEVERLLHENEALKKFQHGVIQRQAMEKMYTF